MESGNLALKGGEIGGGTYSIIGGGGEGHNLPTMRYWSTKSQKKIQNNPPPPPTPLN